MTVIIIAVIKFIHIVDITFIAIMNITIKIISGMFFPFEHFYCRRLGAGTVSHMWGVIPPKPTKLVITILALG